MNRARLLRSGMTDFLTGWHNRRYLHTRIKEELARAQRHGTSVACLMIDVDHFKQTNDSMGIWRATRCCASWRTHRRADSRQRYRGALWGDEFAILLPETGVAEARSSQSGSGRSSVLLPSTLGMGEGCRYRYRSVQRPCSRGAKSAICKALADRLLAEADAALYRAKAQGRGRVEAAETA